MGTRFGRTAGGGALQKLVSIAVVVGVSGAGAVRTATAASDGPRPLSSLESAPPAPTDKPASLPAPETEASPPPATSPSAAPPASGPGEGSPTPEVPDALPQTPAPEPIAPPEPVAPTGFPASLTGLPPLQVHAFASQGAIKSTKNNYLVKHSVRGSVELTEVAINFTQPLTDRLRMGLQLFTSQIGAVGDFRIQADWYYLDYRLADWLGLRAGRTKVPFGLYNEIQDIDSARVPVLLPQSVYPLLSRDLLLAQTGLELYGYLRLGPAGGLEYRAYGGTLYSPNPAAGPGMTLTDYRVPYVYGGRLMWELPVEGLRVGASYLALRADADFTTAAPDPTMSSGMLDLTVVFHLWMTSLEYARDDLLLAAEFGHWSGTLDTNVQSSMQPATTATMTQTNTRYYVMGAYRVVPWLMPGVYYAGLLPNVDMISGKQNHQHDFAATLRFDINSFWLVKLEGHYMLGTASTTPDLNGGKTPDMLDDHWFVFLAKTTAYF